MPLHQGSSRFFLWILLHVLWVLGCQSHSVTVTSQVDLDPPKDLLPAKDMPEESYHVSLAWGRITALKWQENEIWTGHEGGWIARWMTVKTEPRTLHLNSYWLAHQGAVRKLEFFEHQLESLGGDGSWVSWSLDGRALKRGRAPQLMANAGEKLSDHSWVIASDRGVISRVQDGVRLWRTAGEHRRAAFALAVTGDELLSVGSDGWMRRWKLQTGQMLGARAVHQGWATALVQLTLPALEKQNESVLWATAGADGMVRVWHSDVARGMIEAPPVEGVQGHASDITRLIGVWPWLVTGGEDGRLSFYQVQLEEGEPKVKLMDSSLVFERGPVMCLEMKDTCVLAGGGQRSLDLALRCFDEGRLKEHSILLKDDLN